VDRRKFVRMCSSGLAAAAASPKLLAQQGSVEQRYHRVRLIAKDGSPINASSLQPGVAYLFHYPFEGTPCFLINLGKPVTPSTLTDASGQTYEWTGGVGENLSVVAFSAICSHQLSYPSKQRSFINYEQGESKVAGRSQVIVCCAHHSVYDPAQGAKVLDGPATAPLATILLEQHKDSGDLFATGTLGSELFTDYFRAYKRELIQEFGRGIARQQVAGAATVIPLADYTSEQYRC
jgi:arsenite oxidase small subunit